MLSRLLAVAALLAASAPAQAQIYRCEGANGAVEYSNSPTGSSGARNCKTIELRPITTIPAPPRPATRPPGNGVTTPGPANARPGGASPDGFPKVDAATQKARDSDRRRILEEEARKEESRLAELKKEYNNGEPERRGDERNYQKYLDRLQGLKDDMARAEANLVSIRRELSMVKEP